MGNVWASASTGPTTAACVRMDGAARHAAPAPCLWPLRARMVSGFRGCPCWSSHVNAAVIAATLMKWPSLLSTGCTEILTSSQTRIELRVFFYFLAWFFFFLFDFNVTRFVFLKKEAAWRRGAIFFLTWLQVSEGLRPPASLQRP